MESSLFVLSVTAVTIAFTHTIFGPDHYIPFIVLSKAKKWTYKKTMLITFLCGIGHVLSSVILGFVGIFIGISVNKLEIFESTRGNLAAWLLIAFGLIYTVISLRNLYKNRPHSHFHIHADGIRHEHVHTHFGEHAHVHETESEVVKTTPWILFLIFVFGPCEPLIPLLMYPALKHNMHGVAIVSGLFSAVTIGTMMAIVSLSYFGLNKIKFKFFEKYTHVIAGFTILFCGLAIQFLGL